VTPKYESLGVIDQAILAMLDNHLFSSVRNLAKRTCTLLPTVWRQLTRSIGFAVKHCRWVPYKLSDAQLTARAQMSNERLRIFRSAEHQGWQYFMILDELWFYLSTDYEII
jgi:hypothetical protein